MVERPTIRELIQLSIARLLPRLSPGLTEAQAAWARTALEMHILPELFQRGNPQSTDEINMQVEIVASDLLAEGERLASDRHRAMKELIRTWIRRQMEFGNGILSR